MDAAHEAAGSASQRGPRRLSGAGPWLAVGIGLVATLAAAAGLSGAGRLERADFVFTGGGEVTSLDPHTVTGIPEGRVLRLLYEGLVGRDPKTLEPIPAGARGWDVSDDGLYYVFFLRRDARWSNGDPVTAADFAWSMRRVMEPATAAPYAYELFCIRGAREFTTGKDADGDAAEVSWEDVGVRVQDESTLVLELERPAPYLLDLLAYNAFFPVHRASLEAMQAAYPARWRTRWTRPENLVTNGPFKLVTRRANDRMRFAKDPLYWDHERVAFDTIDVLALEHWGTAVNLYLTGEVDWVDGMIPPALVPRLRGREDFVPAPYLGIYFYRLNTTRPPLDDSRVRRALAQTLPRKQICQLVLGAGQQPALTFVPWGKLGEYTSPRILREDEASARVALLEAGYGPNGDPLPPLEISYNRSESHRDIAEVTANVWRSTLLADVRLANQEWKVHLDSQASLDYSISRSSWIADYPDPLNFLKIFVSDGENNKTGWTNARFDELIGLAETELDPAARREHLFQAEGILLSELPIIPIYSYVSQNLVNPRLGGFFPNRLNEPLPKAWYWKDDAELQAARAARGGNVRFAPAPGPRNGKYSPAESARRRAGAGGADAGGGE